jgi:DNA polymerase-3 subunit epsilon
VVIGPLSITPAELDAIIADAAAAPAQAAAAVATPRALTLQPGDKLVFTGTFSRPKSELEAAATGRGLVVKAGVSRAVTLVVAADADTQSGKGAKAEEYGIPIVTEPGFWSLLSEMN